MLFQFGFCQLKPLQGRVIAKGDVEGIHVLNRSSVKYTVTDTNGSFTILAKAEDTLTISSLKYNTEMIIISRLLLAQKNLNVILTEKVTQLDEVVIGKIFTGNLVSDLTNLDVKPKINAEDLGISGYYGKPKTINERKLFDADGGEWLTSASASPFGGGVSINFHKLLNRISGRTKTLKQQVELDNKNKCREALIKEYSEQLFKDNTLTQEQQKDYFYFCMEEAIFKDICKTDDFQVIEAFLLQKLNVYTSRLSLTKD